MALLLALTGGTLVGGATPSPLPGQEAPRVEPGSRVRVTSPALVHRRAEGTMVERSAASLVLRPEGSAATLELPLEHVDRLQVATGSHRGTLRGAFTGLWSGLLLGLIIFEVDEADDEIDPECGELQCFEPPFFVAMSLGGAAVGAGVGYFFHVTEWSDVPVGRLGVSGRLTTPRFRRAPTSGGRPAGPTALELRLDLIF